MTTPMRARSLAQASLHGHAHRVTHKYLPALDTYVLTINADDDRSCAVTPSRPPY